MHLSARVGCCFHKTTQTYSQLILCEMVVDVVQFSACDGWRTSATTCDTNTVTAAEAGRPLGTYLSLASSSPPPPPTTTSFFGCSSRCATPSVFAQYERNGAAWRTVSGEDAARRSMEAVQRWRAGKQDLRLEQEKGRRRAGSNNSFSTVENLKCNISSLSGASGESRVFKSTC